MAAMSEAIRLYQKGMGRINTNPCSIINKKQGIDDNLIPKSNPYQQYQQNSVNTATPQELTLMLYNGLVKFLKLAYQGIEEKNYEKANNNIIKSQSIVTEFMCTLDMQYEISNELFLMYDYMNSRLVEANIKKDISIVEEVIGYAEELRNTWTQAMKQAKLQMSDIR